MQRAVDAGRTTVGNRESVALSAGSSVRNSQEVSATEPCPYCDGTGERAVLTAPTPKATGRPPGNTVAQHGSNAKYTGGCRCRPCKDAHRVYEKARKARRYIAEYEASRG